MLDAATREPVVDGRAAAELRGAFVWAAPGKWFAPGVVSIDARGRVVSVGADPRGRGPRRAIFPGLVNAHVHLQLGPVARAPREFVPWLRAVVGARRGEPGAIIDAAERRTEASLAELLAEGCTAVGEIDSLGTSPALLARWGLAGRCYQELVGFDLDAAKARARVEERTRTGTVACAGGMSPHAPYSASAALVRAALDAASHLAIHVAEAGEELELLRAGTGPLRRLLEDLGRWPAKHRPARTTPIEWLDALGVLSPRSLLVHAQHATAQDILTVVARRAPIVVCPSTIRFFGRTPPDVPAWIRTGVRVALGTDSRASRTRGLSMRHEMALARRMWPSLSAEQIVAMATTHAGRAIGRPRLGRIAAGGRADLCAVALPKSWTVDSAVLGFASGDLSPESTWLGGHRLDLSRPG